MKVYRQNGNLIIEIEEKNMISVAESRGDVKVINRNEFFDYMVKLIPDKEEMGGDKYINIFLDHFVEDAIESASGVVIIG